MKKYLNRNNPLESFDQTIRKDIFKGNKPLSENGGSHLRKAGLRKAGSPKKSRLRRMVFIASFCMMGLRVLAPGDESVLIAESNSILPYSELMHAIGMVETMGNATAYNLFENAVGIFQIRQVKVDEFNRLTGSKYVLTDMYNLSNSIKVFLFFASLEGPYQLEKIAKSWNGSGPMTEVYWKRIKEYL